MKSISNFYDFKKLDGVILHLPEKWSFFSQIYGGQHHDTNLNWFARQNDNLTVKRTSDVISVCKVCFQSYYIFVLLLQIMLL